MLRIGLIGGGRTAQAAHVPALQALHARYAIAAVADRDAAALERIGLQAGVPPPQRFTDFREMLLHVPLDLVIVAVPHAFHHEAVQGALLNGVHVVTERPLALSLRDAEEVLRLAELRGRLVTVLHPLLYYPPFREAIRLVRAGAIGEPFLLRCEGVTGGFQTGTAAYHPEWRAKLEIAGGGAWLDHGYHGSYLCTALSGSPVVSVAAAMSVNSEEITVEDTAVVLLTHENGAASSIQVSWNVPAGGTRVFEVYGTRGAIVFDHDGYPFGLYDNASATWTHPEIAIERDESYIDFFDALAACLSYGAPPPVSHRDALHTLEIVLAAYRANEMGTVESVGGEWGMAA
jgi:predicted dehydrogenase